jgi:hypothetical protein
MINTRRVRDRRKLRFETFADVVQDVDRLAEAEKKGTLRATGNWSLGQAIGHLAAWARYPLEGYPLMPRPPWFVRLLIPLMASGFIGKRMPAGVRIGNVEGGTFSAEPMETEPAIRQLHDALRRLNKQAPTIPNPMLGELTHQEWIMLNLRHAELHLSFFHRE